MMTLRRFKIIFGFGTNAPLVNTKMKNQMYGLWKPPVRWLMTASRTALAMDFFWVESYVARRSESTSYSKVKTVNAATNRTKRAPASPGGWKYAWMSVNMKTDQAVSSAIFSNWLTTTFSSVRPGSDGAPILTPFRYGWNSRNRPSGKYRLA